MDVSVVSGVVVIMECLVLDFMSVLCPALGLCILSFVVMSYRFGVIDCIFLYLCHLSFVRFLV